MYKYLLMSSLLFSGCSYFEFNFAICDQMANDPNAIMPKECKNYNKEEADKAFNKTKVKTSSEIEDELKFKKEEK